MNVKAHRLKLFNKQGGCCHWCCRPCILPQQLPRNATLPFHTATLDHLIPSYSDERSPDYLSNTVMACLLCNKVRGMQSIIDDPQAYLQSVLASQKNNLRRLMPMAAAAPISMTIVPEMT